MKIKFCGADGTTTGSQHLIEVNGTKILLDCGLFQGKRKEAYERNKTFRFFDPAELDVVVLSHAHIDHSGNLPNLAKNGFKGDIFSTFATRDLCQIMLLDSARIQAHDIEYLNEHKVNENDPDLVPIYSEEDANQAMELFVNLNYNRRMKIADGVTLSFHDAGHILGASQVCLDIEDREDGKKKRLLFSGDIGRGNNEILQDPSAVPDVDMFIIESTYGGREHESPSRDELKFLEVIKRSLARGGNIYIPSFAVERTQQLLYILNRLFRSGALAPLPVFVDSPMAVGATEIFRIHPECFNNEMREFMKAARDPFGFDTLRMIRAVSASKELNTHKGQCIIISASGMCEAGRILFHLRNGIGDKHNTVLFVGYCAEETLGRKIRDGWKKVNILGRPCFVEAAIEILDSFSGHADHSELMDYFVATGGSKSKVFIVHGEDDRRNALKDALEAIHPAQYYIPELGEEITC